MSRSVKVAISLPADLLDAVEDERDARGESRSEFFRRAVERQLNDEARAEKVARYVRGYESMPETRDEVAPPHHVGVAGLAGEPWDVVE